MESRVLSSLHKIYPDAAPDGDYTRLTGLRNEALSFQIAFRHDGDPLPVYTRIDAALPVSAYRVDYLPMLEGKNAGSDGGEERTGAGLYPDVLRPRLPQPPMEAEGPLWFEQGERHLLTAVRCWQSLWLTINEEGAALPAGEYPVTVRFYARSGQTLLAEQTVTVTLLPALLPPQKLWYTNWFHADCMADSHRVAMFGEEFFRILHSYAHVAAVHGMNTFLLPAFTPPLDTPVGGERATAQLVGVRVDTAQGERQYSFDFSLMERYIRVCLEAGITRFEHSHFFTQWGAQYAPKVVGTQDGTEKRLFGWDTSAAEGEYPRFLRQYIPALRAFLRTLGLEQRVLFHISDEPPADSLADYAAARAVVEPLLRGCTVGDALSDYAYYQQGLTQTPIVSTTAIEPFLGHCEDLWCYYTGASLQNGLSNRVISLPSARNRVLGMQMYCYGIRGFLEWGYNYTYSRLSHGFDNPASFPGLYDMSNGGAFIVYPDHRGGAAFPSIRLKVFAEGVQDMRALEALEALTGREAVCAQLDRLFGGRLTFHSCPASADALLAVRQAINCAIAAACEKKGVSS